MGNRDRGRDCRRDIFGRRVGGGSDRPDAIRGPRDRAPVLARAWLAAGDRTRGQFFPVEHGDNLGDPVAFRLPAVVASLGIAPVRPVDLGRRRDARMSSRRRLEKRDRILDELLGPLIRLRFRAPGAPNGDPPWRLTRTSQAELRSSAAQVLRSAAASRYRLTDRSCH
jgi:hypothetical protein